MVSWDRLNNEKRMNLRITATKKETRSVLRPRWNMTFLPHEQPSILPNTFCPSENVNPFEETPLPADFDYLIRDFSVTIEWQPQWNCEVWTPSDTGEKKLVNTNRKVSVGVQSQRRIHSDSITEGQYGDEQGPWIGVENDGKRWELKAWEEASIPVYVSSLAICRVAIVSVLLCEGLVYGDFRVFLFHTAFLLANTLMLTSWRLVRLPLRPMVS